MGAKAPAKLKLRRPMYKCDICDRKMLSVQALKTHKNCIHRINEDPLNTTNPTVKLKVYKPTVKSATSNVAPREESSKEELYESSKTKVSDVRRIEFECPECKRLFASYFSAFRHIKKHHCPKSDGSKPKQSVKVPMPVRLEVCVKCNLRIGSDIHVCHEALSTLGADPMTYMCTGCNQKFVSIQLFDLHVAGLHTDDGVESMFFPQMNEFLTWKDHMETQLNIQYLVLGKCTSKQTYHCTYLNSTEAPSDTANICPSSIVVQEFSKGIQVHYYKKHYGHPCPEYTLSEDYKKYSITSLMKQTPGHYKNITNVESDEKDLYIQFKTLMESIVVDAAKIKIDSLKIILGIALEMTSILTNYDEDDETISYPNTKTLTDDQITTALEKLRSKKRKQDSPITKEVVKKAKPSNNEFVSPKIVNAFSVTGTNDIIIKGIEAPKDNDSKLIKKSTKVDTPPPTPKDDNSKLFKKMPKIDTPSSFNDSYKDFVDKNFINRDENNAKPTSKNVQTRNTVAVRTYEGPELRRPRAEKEDVAKEASMKSKVVPIKQKEVSIKPNELPIITKDVLTKPEEVPNKVKEVSTKIKEVPIKTKEVPIKMKEVPVKMKEVPVKTKEVPVKTKEVPSKTKATPIKTKETPVKTKEVPVKTKEVPIKTKEVTAKTKAVKPKKNVVKTKIGQFKPSISPKKTELNRSIDKLKVNFDYEVKEQENDCNILILKI